MNDTTQTDPLQEQLSTGQNEMGDSKAGLAFSNMLREQAFMAENPPQEEGMEEGQTEQPMENPNDMTGDGEPMEQPTEEVSPETPEEPTEEKPDPINQLKEEMTKGMDDLKAEFEKVRKDDAAAHAKELANINKSLKDILNAK